MSSTRLDKVRELLKEEIDDIIRRQVKTPGIGFITITGVEITPDLRYARVFVSILGDEEEQRKTLQALQKAAGFIRGALGDRVRLRRVPELVFRFDTSIEYGDKINRLIKQVVVEERPDEEE